jgi:hypothetical protein
MPDVAALNALIDQKKSPGKVKGGAKASQDRAKNYLTKAKTLKAMVEDLGQKHNVPPAVILGLMARESDFGAGLDKQGWGDNGNAFGVLQVDKRTAKPAGQPDPFSKAHVDQALGIWDDKLAEVKKAHKDWTPAEVLAGAICAYNAGAGNIRTRPDTDANWRKMDDNKPNTDYSADTWAMAAFYREAIWGKATGKPDAGSADAAGTGNVVAALQALLVKFKVMTDADVKAEGGALGPKTHAAVTRLAQETKPTKNPLVEELQQLLVANKCMTAEQMKTGPGLLGPRTLGALTKLLNDNSEGDKKPTGPKPKPATADAPAPAAVSYKDVAKDFKAKIPGSKYFSWHDALFLPSDGRHATEDEASEFLSNIVKQALALDALREYFKAPIVVHCWLRPPAYNKKIGGAKNSAHLRGTATDFHIEGFTADQVRKPLLSDKNLYPGAGELGVSWVHLDLEHKAWFKP